MPIASEILGLKGCAKRLRGAVSAVRSYRDLACGAIGFTVVIVAVLYVALDALNVLATLFFVLHGFIPS